ncbi:MAG: hypothetical protein AAFY03_00935 [Pseudomonadota bacterium]
MIATYPGALPATARRTRVQPILFVASFIAAPLITAAVGYFLVLPIFALFLGGPLWLLIGAPALIWAIRSGMTRRRDFAVLAFAGNLATPLLVAPFMLWTGEPGDSAFYMAMLIFAFGCAFAPLWAAVFVELYQPANHKT